MHWSPVLAAAALGYPPPSCFHCHLWSRPINKAVQRPKKKTLKKKTKKNWRNRRTSKTLIPVHYKIKYNGLVLSYLTWQLPPSSAHGTDRNTLVLPWKMADVPLDFCYPSTFPVAEQSESSEIIGTSQTSLVFQDPKLWNSAQQHLRCTPWAWW